MSEPAQNGGDGIDRSGAPLLDIRGLQTFFHTDEGVVKSVNDVSYNAYPGETVGVVGESGCGKSVTALSVMRLIPMPPGEIAGGEVWFDGENLVEAEPQRMREIRGGKIGMIFQEPMTSLNPVFTVGDQIEEAVRLHMDMSAAEARERAIEMLAKVGIPSPRQRVDEYPHQMSGGMRQRVMIAMALSVAIPKLLIADEPTTALDVTIQAQILDLMREAPAMNSGMSILFITHDLGVIAEIARPTWRSCFAAKLVECKPILEPVREHAEHPYTQRPVPFDSLAHRRAKLDWRRYKGSAPQPSPDFLKTEARYTTAASLRRIRVIEKRAVDEQRVGPGTHQ